MKTSIDATSMVIGLKNRHKLLNEVYVAAVYLKLGKAQSAVPGSGAEIASMITYSRARLWREKDLACRAPGRPGHRPAHGEETDAKPADTPL